MFYTVMSFVLGCSIGSFLNVVIYRLPNKMSLSFPSSMCPNCKNKIKWYDNIPVFSFILLKGKCRNCGIKISIKYPLIEMLTGVIFFFVYLKFGYSVETIKFFILISFLISISFIDIKEQYIPDRLNGLLLIIGILIPIIVMSVAFIIVWGLMTFVVPVFTGMFTEAGVKMPALTQAVMNISNFMSKYWYVVVGGIIFIIIFLVKGLKTPKGKEIFDKNILKVPLMGNLIRIVAVARFTRTMATLLSSGVPILVAFDIAAETCGNIVISGAVFDARDSIKEGNTIAQPLEASGKFPLMVTQMIEVGEESGTITEMLNKVSDFLEADIRVKLNALVSAMEPLTIVVMAVVVGTIVIALFLPLFDIADVAAQG